MEISIRTIVIIIPMLFLAGFTDSIGGGGGLISLPAYLLAGLPIHTAIATNKVSSTLGTSVSVLRFIKSGMVNFRLAVPSVLCAIAGSAIGSRLSLKVDERILTNALIAVLPVTAFLVLNRNLFRDRAAEITPGLKVYILSSLSSFIIGMYDGFYGPGTGTFLIIAFTVFAGLGMKHANAQAKIINFTSNLTAFVIFVTGGQALLLLGIAGGLSNMAGNYVGSGLALKNGSKIIRPIVLFVLLLLFIKVISETL